MILLGRDVANNSIKATGDSPSRFAEAIGFKSCHMILFSALNDEPNARALDRRVQALVRFSF